MTRKTTIPLLMSSVFLLIPVAPARAQSSTLDLKRLSIQELLDIPVTTVSRLPEETMNVPAAVFVITHDDIVRSGARSIPEALRLAPGLQVARINAGTWSIGMRGFADRLARSMLVLIDGRAVYSPLFAGTYWEVQDTLLSDIDRIEVIRGPGGTLWGANAVNGIINIITRAAGDTQGWLAGVGGGSEARAMAGLRYGGRSGALDYRAYAKVRDDAAEFHADGSDFDAWQTVQAGFRGDWAIAPDRAFTLQGDAYGGRLGSRPALTTYAPPYSVSTNRKAPLSGGNVIARYSGTTDTSGFQLQAYYDRTSRREVPVAEDRDTLDLDFQQTLRPSDRHVLVWGSGYRVTSGAISAVLPTAFTPARRTDNLFSAFLQDDVVLVADRWHLTAGSKIEHNAYSGVEVQPTLRLLWTPARRHTLFGAVTRAVRTPSRVETDYTTTSFLSAAPAPTFVRLLPNPSFVSEKLVAYELGYRMRTERAYLTASGFYNHFTDLLGTDLVDRFTEGDEANPRTILAVQFANGLHGASYGAEITGDVRLVAWLRLTANYSYIDVTMNKDPGSRDVSQVNRYENLVAHHQTQAGLSLDLGRGWSADVFGRYISSLAAGPVPAYGTMDVRAALAITPRVRIAVVGQDLLDRQHLEWQSGATTASIRRSVYASLAWTR
jgi:iron complex outermembrane receptor protein